VCLTLFTCRPWQISQHAEAPGTARAALLMKPVADKLDGKDILDPSAYVASLPVPAK
jgi:cytochrome c553